ncbi:hypothetical protein BJY04DRAFT_100402 [Aspergillus karnatakaensis]|uniref:uncharacterized protein n=1 Tax=Aspergillus karnatakaensis TaxID=1810916 RepID=UPI003CCD9986
MHGLIQTIRWAHVSPSKLHIPSSSSLSSSTNQSLFRTVLQKWTTSWRTTTVSTLESVNPSGPLPFTSSALLASAYIYNSDPDGSLTLTSEFL